MISSTPISCTRMTLPLRINHGHFEPGMHVMTKPFQMDTFARRVKELIGKL